MLYPTFRFLIPVASFSLASNSTIHFLPSVVAVLYSSISSTVTLSLAFLYLFVRYKRNSGISKELLPLIFDRYYRDEKYKREVVGTGLGLSICKEILKKHDFAFGVQSEEGKGSTFWFEADIAKPKKEKPTKYKRDIEPIPAELTDIKNRN